MRYIMRQKLFCFGRDYTVLDDQGRECFIVDGAAFTIRDSTTIRDMAGTDLCWIRRRMLSLRTTYEIDRGGNTTTIFKHLFTLLRCRFSIDVPGPNDLEAEGNLLDHEYRFVNAELETVAEVSKRWFTIRDTYGVDIKPGHDDVLILAATVVIDLCCHEKRD